MCKCKGVKPMREMKVTVRIGATCTNDPAIRLSIEHIG